MKDYPTMRTKSALYHKEDHILTSCDQIRAEKNTTVAMR